MFHKVYLDRLHAAVMSVIADLPHSTGSWQKGPKDSCSVCVTLSFLELYIRRNRP